MVLFHTFLLALIFKCRIIYTCNITFAWGDIVGLLEFLQKIPDINEIKGGFGEYLAKYYSKITTDTFVLHDVMIDAEEGKTSQIDLLMIGRKGIYVVEVKNYENAMIYGNGKNNKWYYYRGGKKYDIYSPLKQNKKHIQYLKEHLKYFGDVPCFSVLLILCKDFKVTNINEDSNKPDTVIVNGLIALTEGFKQISDYYPEIYNEEQKKNIYDYVMNNQHIGKEIRQEHKQRLQQVNKEIQSLKNNKICPYCKTELVMRKGKYGEFYGCKNYPKCRYTQQI